MCICVSHTINLIYTLEIHYIRRYKHTTFGIQHFFYRWGNAIYVLVPAPDGDESVELLADCQTIHQNPICFPAAHQWRRHRAFRPRREGLSTGPSQSCRHLQEGDEVRERPSVWRPGDSGTSSSFATGSQRAAPQKLQASTTQPACACAPQSRRSKPPIPFLQQEGNPTFSRLMNIFICILGIYFSIVYLFVTVFHSLYLKQSNQ